MSKANERIVPVSSLGHLEITTEPTTPSQPPAGSWAETARLMALFEDPNDPSGVDWDDWKDRMKDEEGR